MATEQKLIIGIHSVSALLSQKPEQISGLLIQAGRRDRRLQKLLDKANSSGIAIEELDKSEMERRVGGVHQGVAALYEGSETTMNEPALFQLLDTLQTDPLLLVLDEVTDPHNLGACLRSADAAGVHAVIIPKDRAAPLTATVSKVASGAAETVNLIVVTNLARCLQKLKQRGIWLVGTDDQSGKLLFEQDLTGPLALVLGSEGTGLRRLTRETCDFLVAIPMAGAVSSLNVSVAAGVALFEAVRQRRSD
ncbi:MAG TPA: 23S rRNA (guanosine(2251)-2'-O)-methyltransferase RlmB [Gammaproteobacteria bacterium]|jgi:23S rRNA (guanosine2251-2'-O)-methyltransferase|nr:23S rRNA (guanosine(2251)-2'-O)-methyltransferase RlmB [Gammaproteobacteria bacterium]MDP6731184.1 23S rRNA (guanosine(2251)-2'-O)-methyltransferase RlmB [Gammaproteobacteria bacterium]HAJ76613.1 23S rRNA (guanosine(2251)-2'-O)-methyltransferase RlmB [Gammaproteobacteria bacterium]|tara:strand:+ start:2032 stop:2781 length:750 start_codon:yes stop_codon:yes gene_type:complete